MKQEWSSGATVEVSVAGFATTWKLLAAVVLAFKQHGIDLKVGAKANFTQLLQENLSGLLNGFLDVIVDPYVMDLLFECGKSAIYTKNGVMQKISKDTFEDEANRGDFIEAMYIVAKENLSPFFPKALTKSLETLGQTINTAKKS